MENIDPSVYERADEGLLRLIEKAKVSALSEEEYDQYEASMKYLEDEIDMEQNGYERGLEEGMKKGVEKGIHEGERSANLRNAKNLKTLGVDIHTISQATGLSVEEIEKL